MRYVSSSIDAVPSDFLPPESAAVAIPMPPGAVITTRGVRRATG